MKLPIPIAGYQQSAWEGSINLGTPRGLKITKRLQRGRKEEEPFQYINHPPLCILGPAIYIINDSAQLPSLAAITWHVLPDVTLPRASASFVRPLWWTTICPYYAHIANYGEWRFLVV